MSTGAPRIDLTCIFDNCPNVPVKSAIENHKYNSHSSLIFSSFSVVFIVSGFPAFLNWITFMYAIHSCRRGSQGKSDFNLFNWHYYFMSFQMNPAATKISCEGIIGKRKPHKRTYAKGDVFPITSGDKVSGDSFIEILGIDS